MADRGDKYRNASGAEAALTMPAVPYDDDDEYCWFSYGAIVSVSGMVVAHIEPWPPCHSDDPGENPYIFRDENVAADLGDALLKTLGFVPVKVGAGASP